MTPEERAQIINNDYFDLIIAYNENINILNRFNKYTTQIMNDRYAIIYVPATQMTDKNIVELGFSAIPVCYGLTVQSSLEASGILRVRRTPALNLRGRGVLIGIIDTGIDYTNAAFKHADGTTKIQFLWDQTAESENGFPEFTNYGTEYTAEQINLALQSDTPYDIVPSRDEIGHGTMMAGIAAGSESPANDFSGVAPESDLIIVKLKQAKSVIRDYYVFPPGIPIYQENDIMWGIQYLTSAARRLKRPIAICIGLGSSLTSHDGRDYLSDVITVGSAFPGVAFSIAAGNQGNARRHYYAAIDPDIGYDTVELNVGENETGFTMQLWGTLPSTYSIDILSPSGEYIPRIEESLRLSREITFIFESTVINVDYIVIESRSGDQLIMLRFRKPTAGVWRIQVYSRGDIQGTFHIWLPMDDLVTEDTYFIQSNPYTTVTSPGNADVPICATAYNSENNILYQNSGKGFNRAGAITPTLAAPGVNILSPNLNQGFSKVTGTSAAVAHTAGVTAMILEWGIVKGNYPDINTIEVKNFLIRGADRTENLLYPNRDWGYGILDVYNAFNILRSETQTRQ